MYRLVQGTKSAYARDDAHRDELLAGDFSGRGKVEISRFKGLGEMLPAQLKETTMLPANRTLLQVQMAENEIEMTARVVKQLMGNKPEDRFNFITERAQFVDDVELDI